MALGAWHSSSKAISLIPGLLTHLIAARFEFSGQASLVGTASWSRQNWQSWSACRYLPEVLLELPVSHELKAGFGTTALGQLKVERSSSKSTQFDATTKAHRAMLWLAGNLFDIRAGLQQVNFGSATLLRPLQWFDQLDPADPLAFTDGVWGLLLRLWPWGNTAIWTWTLIDTNGPVAWNLPALRSPRFQFGGRSELPLPQGEAALTFHHLCASDKDPGHIIETAGMQAENRIGFDAKIDVGIGMWAEATYTFRSEQVIMPNWNSATAVGLNYTFAIGNGLAVLFEHLVRAEPSGWSHTTAGMADYPLSLLDNVRIVVLTDWSNHRQQGYLTWQRQLDNWLFSIAGSGSSNPAQTGLQFMIAFNH